MEDLNIDNMKKRFCKAEHWLTNQPMNTWIRFDSIPEDIFKEVFSLIDSGYRWRYYFDDLDESFKKNFKCK